MLTHLHIKSTSPWQNHLTDPNNFETCRTSQNGWPSFRKNDKFNGKNVQDDDHSCSRSPKGRGVLTWNNPWSSSIYSNAFSCCHYLGSWRNPMVLDPTNSWRMVCLQCLDQRSYPIQYSGSNWPWCKYGWYSSRDVEIVNRPIWQAIRVEHSRINLWLIKDRTRYKWKTDTLIQHGKP